MSPSMFTQVAHVLRFPAVAALGVDVVVGIAIIGGRRP
jgi:hypothetical protein